MSGSESTSSHSVIKITNNRITTNTSTQHIHTHMRAAPPSQRENLKRNEQKKFLEKFVYKLKAILERFFPPFHFIIILLLLLLWFFNLDYICMHESFFVSFFISFKKCVRILLSFIPFFAVVEVCKVKKRGERITE